MGTYLDPEYVKFVKRGDSLGHVVQEVIDRMQYADGFMTDLYALLLKYESPFETVMETQEQVPVQVRKLKSQYREVDNTRSAPWNGDYLTI
mgnify:CR=1 FL=1